MNKQKFTKIVKEYHSISADDRNKLHELVNSYPYSQVIHTLVAKANMDAGTDIAKQTLAYAAMYSADRSVLKEIIASRPARVERKPASQKMQPSVVKQERTEETKKAEEKKQPLDLAPKVNKITIDPAILKSGEPKLSDTIMKDLDDLRQSKASYMEWLNLPDEENDEPATKKSPSRKATKVSKPAKSKTSSKSKPAAKKEKEVKAKSTTTKGAKTTTKKSTSKAKTTNTKNTPKTAKKAVPKKSTSKKEDPQKSDQHKIIEKFIAQEPSITAKASRKSPENQEDLSVASTSFNEDLVSENLAKILISQGKSDKAIDIYKKLIWKFPQKKAYFASQIEELKNKK